MGILATLLMQIGKFIAFTPIVVLIAGLILATIFECTIAEDSYHACVVGGIDFGFLNNLEILAFDIPFFLITGATFGIIGYLLSKLDEYLKRPKYTVK